MSSRRRIYNTDVRAEIKNGHSLSYTHMNKTQDYRIMTTMHTDNDGGFNAPHGLYCCKVSATVAAARGSAVRPYLSICV